MAGEPVTAGWSAPRSRRTGGRRRIDLAGRRRPPAAGVERHGAAFEAW